MALGPHSKVIIGWIAATTVALTGFYFSRQSINQKRYNLMIQERQQLKEEKLRKSRETDN